MKRDASHAGSWYTADKDNLNHELDLYFEKANTSPLQGVRAIIGPHAGFRYSGPTAAYAYKLVDTTHIKRVFLLGPSHHAYIDGCCLSKCDIYKTPLGNLKLDKQVIQDLYETDHFDYMRKNVDEDEHSIEMHLPFTFKIFQDKIEDIKIVPILVGATSEKQEKLYGDLLAKYLESPENLFIISSDFCHWGSRFDYTYYTKKKEDKPVFLHSRNQDAVSRPIHESIRELDYQGIQTLEDLSFSKFQAYLKQTQNTICGRHPIGVLMAALEILKDSSKQTIQCVHYDQSSQCKDVRDSSVSYASIYVQIQ
ncbi:MEMO1 protein [Gilbertella persicaria]|uniref:MEMO1 protein n=1 Tax=Gilbertella persicaria TaxID=101096 RepID=UPI002221129B|nr:MEMO1 protein [Gilbertella persicaria]KAI8090231.1 MEMO1 protein [Gilbertella persicaria]